MVHIWTNEKTPHAVFYRSYVIPEKYHKPDLVPNKFREQQIIAIIYGNR